MPPTMPSFLSFKSLNSKIAVRSRIVAIAVIPVIGFLTNGIAFTAGETDVESAFLSVKHASLLADASEQFKGGLAAMRIGVRDFIADPNRNSIAAVDAAIDRTSRSLDTIETS